MPMNTPNNGQSGQSGAYERSRRWQDIPVEVLRAWARDHPLSYREMVAGVAAVTGVDLAPETIRKFARGIGQPERSTIRALALFYLQKHPWGYVAEKGTPYGTPKPLPLLSEMLPEGHAEARAEIEKLVELAKRFPDEVPASAERLRGWLQKMIDAEYTGEDLSKRPLDSDGRPVPKKP